MATHRQGRASDTFEKRCMGPVASTICQCIGDQIHVDGCRGCYVWGRDAFKNAVSTDAGISFDDSEIAIYWPSCEHRPVQCGSQVVRMGKRYSVSNGSPRNLHNGWMCAELDYCGGC